ncbi:MAG: hypothetical protein IKW28_08195 [Lachnospiraceae bacterium]|nr:hypothetical protein [Lachnospiraceae bacterium]
MFYQSNKMMLECIRTVFQGKVNDVYVCRDRNTGGDTPYTLLVIKDHTIARKYLEVFENREKRIGSSYIESFSDNGQLCMVFEYKQERPLENFYMGAGMSLAESEEICIRLILHCMESSLPYPILYLLLEQKQIHLAKDHTIYWSYFLNLEKLDQNKDEKDCVLLCAVILKKLLESKVASKGFAYRVLEKKIQRESYRHFAEVYKDLRISATPAKEKGLGHKLLSKIRKKENILLRMFYTVCTILIILAVVSLVSHLLFGDIPWLRVIFNGFKQIGSESLLQ